MKRFVAILFFVSLAITAFSQSSDVDSLINQGVAFHDEGRYDEAIDKFEKALDLDKKSVRAQYELANTFIVVGRFDDAIEYTDKIIKADGRYADQAFTLKGTALDMQNKPEKAIKTYKKGLEKFPDVHMLWFNLSVTYLKNNNYQEGEAAAAKAVALNRFHPGSNQIFGYAHYYQHRKSQSLLPLYHFLILENKSKRAASVYQVVLEQLGSGVKKKGENDITISINVNSLSDPFNAADLALGMSAVTALATSDGTTLANDYTKVAKLNASFFEALTTMKQEGLDENFKFYVAMFADLHQKGHTEAFSYWISRATQDDKVKTWIENNEEKVTKFVDWYNAYGK